MSMYRWDEHGTILHGELTDEQVALMAENGMTAEVLTTYLLWKDGEFTGLPLTASELAELQASGWSSDALGDAETVRNPVIDAAEPRGWREKTSEERKAPESCERAAARKLLTDADVQAAIAAVQGEIATIAAEGVVIEAVTFQGVEAALESALDAETNQGRVNRLLRAGQRLQSRWNRVVYHCGTLRDAYRLWPEFLAVLSES